MRAVPTRDTVLPSERRRGRGSRRRPTHASVKRSVAALRSVPLFDGFSNRHLRHLAEGSDLIDVAAGHAIVEEGQAGEAMFVILGGSARVVRNGRRVAGLIPGDFFGELSALDGGPRTASVVADTDMELLRLFRHTLYRVVKEEPRLAIGLLEGIARRLRQVQPASPIR
jgi:CRP/FNR family transcriptional regulator, cyclic AMP receptor protein